MGPGAYEIRRVAPGDEPQWLSAVATVLSEAQREGRTADREEAAAALEERRCMLFLALAGDRPIGLLSAYTFPDVACGGRMAYLYDIEVLAAHRRAGVGTALVEALTAACEAEGIRAIWAGTDVENHAARRTFERTGAEAEDDTFVEYEWELDGRRSL